VGIVANQARYLGGVIDAAGAEKAARFVSFCDRWRLPLIVLVDTPGFLPGTAQERAGVIRRGADLLHAFAAATVPRLTVVLRKGYGGGYITMNARDLGADLVLAWPGAEIGIMGPRQAVQIMHRRALAAAPDPDAELRRLSAAYAGEHLDVAVAARDGHVDEVVEPSETRDRLAHALAVLTPRQEVV
jgi:acetyl-CoA carboxylase carboxyltransferase component